MKRQWRVRRQPQPHPNAQQRWDRAYQLLAEWAQAAPLGTSEATGASPEGGGMRIGIYARVSTQRQAQAQGIEQKLERLQAHVTAHAAAGWEVREEHVFRDDGYSGAHLRRPGLDRLRDAVAAAALDRVLVTAPDRLARNYVHQMLLLDEWTRCGCQVEFLERPMGQDPHDQLHLQIRSAVAEYERTLIAERMRRGRLRKLQPGVLLPWTRASYGYRLDPELPRDPAGVRVEEAEAAVLREVFAQYLEPGGSLAGVAKRLFALGVPTPTGKRCWHPNTVRLLLTNPAYTGQVYTGRSRARPEQARWSALRPVRPARLCAVWSAPDFVDCLPLGDTRRAGRGGTFIRLGRAIPPSIHSKSAARACSCIRNWR
jgi:site-specific DNA recombinase